MKWLKNIFKSKPKQYFYFKKVVNKFHGLCGSKRLYMKIEKETGSCCMLFDMQNIERLSRKGFIQILKVEYLARSKTP